ncbi:MAG: ABC transporter permease [Candidatus Bathyarchaeia archaeon]
MSETFFSINDLFRRKLQTSLIVISLTLCVASTLFLLLFCDKIGFGISLMAEGTLTTGLSIALSRFIIFIGTLIFIIGALIVSFMVFVMMSQRIRDIGLMKAAGCPNDLIFGYLMTELLIVTLLGCFLGVVLGIVADFAITNILTTSTFQISQKPINFWIALFVFAVYFILALIFGTKPILDTTKIETSKALSPTYYLGMSKEPSFKIVSKIGLTIKIAMRSLFRRKLATIRILSCLTAAFILVTVAVAGGIIADQTTKSWVERAIGKDIVVIAHQEMCNQYGLLLSKFHKAEETVQFDYTDNKYLLSDELLNQLSQTSEIASIDMRLIVEARIREVPGYILNPETGGATPIGDSREGVSLIVGVEPEKVLADWFLDGEFLKKDKSWEAVIGDSIAHKMFTLPLKQELRLFGQSDRFFNITGVCVDPLNNGNVTYVPLKDLQNVTGIPKINIILVRIDALNNRAEILNRIRANVTKINSNYEVFELNLILRENIDFLGYVWSIILFLPFFSLASASVCLICYMMLILTEQRQEFGVLRALGAKPKTVLKIVSWQSLAVLLSSYALGIAFGIIITLLILVQEPLVTSLTIIEIAGWLSATLAVIFIFSLYPAIKFSKKSLIEIMAQS